MKEDEDLSLGQRVHLAHRDLKSVLRNTYVALGIGITLFVLVLTIGIPATQFIESFGHYEDKLNSASGPRCNPDNYKNSDYYPAQIFVIKGKGAEQGGMKDGDIITRINNLKINNAKMLNEWKNKLDVKPGDSVNVEITREGSELSLSIITTPSEEDPQMPMLGIIIPENPSCSSYFVLNEGAEFTEDSLRLVLSEIWLVVIVTGLFGAALIVAFLVWRPTISKLKSEMTDWENDYLYQNYIMIFETMPPKGISNGEKIFKMAQIVFPELRKDPLKEEKWKGPIIAYDLQLDCFQTTYEKYPRLFVAKHFDDKEITVQSLQEICKIVKKSRKIESIKKKIKNVENMEISRLICVGKNYESRFLKDRKLEKIMDELDFEYPIDLVLEKDENYRVLWVDYE